jgi:glycosyltransferase involved in cell wall biosynthesis
MTTETKDDFAPPLAPALRALLLPEVVAKVAMGATVELYPREVVITFESDAIRIHPSDFEIVQRVAKRVREKITKTPNRSAVIRVMVYAQQFMAEETFRPAATRILYYATLSDASAFYRCLMPQMALNQSGTCVAHATKGQYSRTSFEYDVVVIQIDSSPSVQQFARKLQEMGKKVIYEVDDAFDALEEWHPGYISYGQPERLKAMYEMMQIADAVQVSTPFLADRYRKYAKRIEVVPNMIELSTWPQAERLRKDGLFKVIWAGSQSHAGDLELVAPALAKFCKAHPDVRIVFFGQALKDCEFLAQCEIIPWCDFAQYAFTLAAVDADMAIAPLVDVPFNHGKSNLRILQMWATGYPTVASDVGPYRDAILGQSNGMLAKTTEDWIQALEEMYASTKLQNEISAQGFESVKKFDVRPNVEKLEAFYTSVAKGK